MANQDLSMMILMQAQDQASSIIQNVGAAFGPVGSAIGMAASALVGFTAQSVQTASQFQSSMGMVQSLTGATTQQMAQYSTGVKQLATDTGVAATQLTNGLYFMTSAGYSGSDALKMLTLSTKDSVIGQTDATTTANALSTAMRGFGLDIKQADAVNGMMLRTVTAGKMSMSDYASAISKTSSVAVQYHDSMLDMNAVLATLTSNGIKNANVAGTDYNNLLKVLNGNTDSVAKKSKALNSAFDETKFASMSVADKVNYLNSMIIQHGHNISDVIGKQQNAAAAFTVLANNSKMYANNLKTLGDAQANANATQSAWAITQSGLSVQMNRMQAALQNVMIDLGNAFLPILTKVMAGITGLITSFTDWENRTHTIENAMSGLGTALQAVWDAITKVGSVVMQVWDAIAPIFNGLASQAQGWGANMMDGFIGGVESMIGDLVTMLEGVAQEIANFIGFASPSKKGPGRNLMSWGPALIQSFAQGIVASGSSVQDAVAQIAQIASDGLQGTNAQGAGSTTGSGFASSMVSIGSGLQTVSLGHPFGAMPGSSSSKSSSAASNPIVSALSTTTTALTATTTKHAAAIAASTQKHAAAVAAALSKHQAALAKHAATVAAALTKHQAVLAKHAAALAAATQKHAQALAKHSTTAAATAAKHQAAMVKHAAAVAAALKKHEEVLTREAANKAKQEAKAAAKSAGKAGGGGVMASLTGINTDALAGLKIPDVGKSISQNVQSGLNTAKKQVSATTSQITANVTKLMKGLKPAWDSFVAGIMSIVKTIQSQYIPALMQAWQAYKPFVMGIVELVQNIVRLTVAFGVWVVKSGTLQAVWNGIVMYIKLVITVAGVLITILAQSMAPVFQQIVDTVKQQLWPSLVTLYQALVPLFPIFQTLAILIGGSVVASIIVLISIVGGLLRGIGQFIAGLIQFLGGLIQFFSGAITIILGIVMLIVHICTGQFGLVGEDLNNIMRGIVLMFQGMWNIVVGIIRGTVGVVIMIVVGFVQTLISLCMHLYDTLVGHSIFPDLATAIVNIFSNLANSATNFGRAFMQNLINGISSMVGNVAAAAGNVAQTIKNMLGWHSPTKEGPGRDSDKWSKNLVKMMGDDLDDDGVKRMKKSAQNVAQAIATGLSNPQTQAAIATVLTSAGVALPNYNAGTGQTIADQQPVMASAPSSSNAVAGRDVNIHVHLDNDASKDAQEHGKRVAQEVSKQLAKMARGQSITPRFTSGGH